MARLLRGRSASDHQLLPLRYRSRQLQWLRRNTLSRGHHRQMVVARTRSQPCHRSSLRQSTTPLTKCRRALSISSTTLTRCVRGSVATSKSSKSKWRRFPTVPICFAGPSMQVTWYISQLISKSSVKLCHSSAVVALMEHEKDTIATTQGRSRV